jgi:hypothetical protein
MQFSHPDVSWPGEIDDVIFVITCGSLSTIWPKQGAGMESTLSIKYKIQWGEMGVFVVTMRWDMWFSHIVLEELKHQLLKEIQN